MTRYEYLDRTEKEWQTQPQDGEWSVLTADDDYYDVFDDYQRYAENISNLERAGYNDFTYIDKNGEKHYVAVRAVKWFLKRQKCKGL